MADNRIDIEIKDSIAPTIVRKIGDIATNAKKTHTSVEKLTKAIKSLGSESKIASAANKNALAQEKLNKAWLDSESALQRAIATENKASLSQIKLNNEVQKGLVLKQKSNAINNKNRIAQERLNQAWLGSEAALQRAITAESRAETAQSKLNNEVKKGSVLQQKLSTETQKTNITKSNAASAASRAEAAESRAAIAAIKLTNAQNRLNKSVRRGTADYSGLIRTMLIYAGIGLGGREILGLGDAYTILQNKLRNVTESEAQLTTVTERVFKVANETRTSVDATAQAFQRFDRAMAPLGASQEESLRLTKTVNEQLVIGGAAASEQASGLLQLSQAFNKGKLDGDEFRSVMELMPGTADAIAKQLGRQRGELLKLAPQGKITASVMRKALASVADETDRKFSKLVPTVGQAFTVLKNNAIKFFGELNKKYKITEKFSKLLITMANNMDYMGVALVGLISILSVGFAPAIARGLLALKGFALAIATNPIALLIIALTTAIGYLAIFKDDIKVSEDGVVSFGDTVKGVFSVIGELIEPVTDFFRSMWSSSLDDVDEKVEQSTDYFTQAHADAILKTQTPLNKFKDNMKTVLSYITGWIKFSLNYWVALFVGSYNVISKTWGLLPTAVGDVFKSLYNQLIDYVISASTLFNDLLANVNYINNKAGNIFFEGRLEPIDTKALEKSKADVSLAAYEVGTIFKEEYSKAFETDFIGEFIEKSKNASRKIANDRIAAEKKTDGGLRKTGKNKSVKSGTGKGKSYADIIAENVRAIESQIKGLQFLGAKQNVVNKIEQISNSLLSKKKKLKDDDRAQLVDLLTIMEREKAVHQELNSIYDETLGKREKDLISRQALYRANERGLIDTAEYKNRLVLLNDEVTKSTVNNEKFNQIYDERVIKERELKASVEGITKAYQLNVIGLFEYERLIKNTTVEQQKLKNNNETFSNILNETTGVFNTIEESIHGVNMAYRDGIIDIDNYSQKILDLKLQMIDLKLQAGDATATDLIFSSLGQLTEGFDNVATSIRDSFGGLFTNLSDGFADSIGQAIVMGDDLGESLKNVAKGAMAELISSVVKMGVQWVATKALETGAQSAALTAQTTASVAAAQVTGLAWATPAALVSLASFGANSAPASAGISATVGLTNVLSAIPGFEQGGYTGNKPNDDIAGVVHGGEYVMNAQAVDRIGLYNLESLQAGAASVARNNQVSSGNGPQSQQSVGLGGTKIINIIDPALVGDFMATAEGEELVINTIRRNSEIIAPLVLR